MKTYEKRIIAFLDILGFRHIISQTIKNGVSNDKEIARIQNLFEALRIFSGIDDPKSGISKSKQITQFSDSIVISFEISEESEVFMSLLDMLHISINCVWKGFLVRGGVVFGDVIHDDKSLFGPGMVRAYDMESKYANFPRIVLSDEVLKIGMKYHASHHDPNYEKAELLKIVTKDDDGLYYVDYFKAAQAELDDPNYEMPEYIERLRKVTTTLHIPSDQSLMAKYEWMRNKFNSLIDMAKSTDHISTLTEMDLHDLIPYYKKVSKI